MLRFLPLALLAAPAGAQEVAQTPEGAHRFLAALAEKRQLWVLTSYRAWPAIFFSHRVVAVGGANCESVFQATPDLYFHPDKPDNVKPGHRDWTPERLDAVQRRHALARPPFRVDWSSVSSVTVGRSAEKAVNGYSTTVLINAGGAALALDVDGEALAKRVRYAAQFLAEYCDKTAETGF